MDKEFSEQSLKALIASEIADARLLRDKDFTESLSRNEKYYNGIMEDTPSADGWSKFQTRDVSDVMGWTLPGIIRVFTASDRMVDYQPRRPGDEDFTDQASDYANFIFWNDNDGYRILWDATHDSLLLADGIVKTWWDDSEICEYSTHTGLSAEALTLLLEDEDVEIVSQSEDTIELQGDMGESMSVPIYDVKIKRVESQGRIKIQAIEPENFLKDRTSINIEDARFLAHRDPHMTRSGLIKLGFDRDIVEGLPGNTTSYAPYGDDFQRGEFEGFSQGDRSTDLIELYECYIKADVNGDGIAETVLAYYAGNGGAGALLDWEVWDDEPCFTQIPCEPVPHRFQSRSLAGEVVDIQQIKTVMTRQMLDNAYQVNNPRLDIEAGSIINMDELVNPTVGGVLLRKQGTLPVNYNIVPSIMENVLAGLQHMDTVTEMRTGVSRATMALDPLTLQNQTATASNNQMDSRYSQVELIARNQAELGWKKVFEKVLKLIVKHQDRPRMIRLRDEWVPMDPREWNAGMDAVINVGLGTGSRDRDMSMLNQILATQIAFTDRFQASGMSSQAIDMIPRITKTATKIAEAAGIRNADSFYPEIKPEEMQQLQQKAEAAAQQPPPEVQIAQQKMQADMQVQQAKIAGDQQKAQADMQITQQKDAATLQLEQQKMQMSAQMEQMKIQSEMELKRYQIDAELSLKREQLVAELALKREQIAAELELKRESNAMNAAVKASATSGVSVGGEPG
jgi:hypothetical protein